MLRCCFRLLSVMGLWACSATNRESSPPADRYSIATQNYAVLAEKALTYQADFDLEGWGSMLADDVQYLPLDSTHPLVGKKAVLAYWNNHRTQRRILSLRLNDCTYIPLQLNRSLDSQGPSGVYVYTTCRSEQRLQTGQNQTRHWVIQTHFNDQKLIDRLYTYANQVL